ncbi:MAG: MucR family transcriptional regulator [bacterium]
MSVCEDCGRETKRIYGMKSFKKRLCQTCYNYYQNGGEIHQLPAYAEVKYDDRGYPICHICGKAYKKILTHVWQFHDLSEKEYKKKFGLDKYKGIVAEFTKKKLQKSVKEHYELVVKKI